MRTNILSRRPIFVRVYCWYFRTNSYVNKRNKVPFSQALSFSLELESKNTKTKCDSAFLLIKTHQVSIILFYLLYISISMFSAPSRLKNTVSLLKFNTFAVCRRLFLPCVDIRCGRISLYERMINLSSRL